MDNILLWLLPYVLALAAALYRMASLKKFDSWMRYVVYAGLLLALLTIENSGSYALIISAYVLFNAVAFTYGNRNCIAFSAIALIYLALSIGAVPMLYIMQAALFGFLSEMHGFSESLNMPASDAIEIKRDIIQFLFGLLFIGVAAYMAIDFTRILSMFLALIGLAFGSYVISSGHKSSKLVAKLFGLERNFTKFGHGAMWLGIGVFVALAFLQSNLQVAAVFASIFVGDAIATIIGRSLHAKPLRYNKKKSIYGSLAYFASAGIICYMLLGFIGIAVAFVAAVVESLPIPIDDNATASVATTAFLIIANAVL